MKAPAMKTPAARDALSPRPAPDLHHELRHYIALMRLLGGWPVQPAGPVDTRSAGAEQARYEATPWRGGRMLACYVIHLAQAGLIAVCLRYTVSRLLSGAEKYIERVVLVLHVLYETMPLSVPVLHWHTGREVADYFNAWTRLQASWLAVTGTPLRFQCGRRTKYVAAFVFVFSIISPLYHMRISPHLFAWKVPVYVSVVMQAFTQSLLWRTLNVEVVETAGKLPRLFRRHVKRGTLTGGVVRGYCMLWLRLRSLTHALGEAWGTIMLHCLLVMLLMSMTSCYGLLYALSQGLWRRVASTFITTLNAAMIINWICSESDRAVRHVSRGMLLELLTTPLGRLDAEAELEVMRFVQVLQFKPVCLKLRRFVVVNRELSAAAATTITTYIVVLTQLALGMSAMEDHDHAPAPSKPSSP